MGVTASNISQPLQTIDLQIKSFRQSIIISSMDLKSGASYVTKDQQDIFLEHP